MKTLIRLILIMAVTTIILAWVTACFSQSVDTGGWRASTLRATAEDLWQWSEPAEHHKAVVKVRSSTGSAGSGVYVAYNGCIGVLTAAHILDGTSFTCTFSDGSIQTREGTVDKYGHDIGWVFVSGPQSITALSIAGTTPRQGDRVEFVTRGGPKSELRHFWGSVGSDGGYDAMVISGDSGGAILNERHEVVGIQSAGRSKSINREWGVYRGSYSAPHDAIKAFCDRVVAAGCRPGRCPPQGRGVDWGLGVGGGIQFYPPVRPQPHVRLVPVQPRAPKVTPEDRVTPEAELGLENAAKLHRFDSLLSDVEQARRKVKIPRLVLPGPLDAEQIQRLSIAEYEAVLEAIVVQLMDVEPASSDPLPVTPPAPVPPGPVAPSEPMMPVKPDLPLPTPPAGAAMADSILDGVCDRLNELGKQVAQFTEDQIKQNRILDMDNVAIGRLDRSLSDRLDGIETALAGQAEQPSGLLTALLPNVLRALGWTAPPSLALIASIWLLRRLIWRRKAKQAETSEQKGGSAAADTFRGNGSGIIPRDDSEAAELLRLSQLEGRSPLHDAIIGRFALDALDNLAESHGPQQAWAASFKTDLEKRFNDVAPPAVFGGAI